MVNLCCAYYILGRTLKYKIVINIVEDIKHSGSSGITLALLQIFVCLIFFIVYCCCSVYVL